MYKQATQMKNTSDSIIYCIYIIGLVYQQQTTTMATQTETQTSLRAELKAAFDGKTHDGVLSTYFINILLTADTDVMQYEYAGYLPVYDNVTKFPPTEPFEFRDRGLDADKSKPNILQIGNSDVVVNKLTPRVGTEIRGLQLSSLTDTQKNELALLIAERGVVVFRDQDFKDIGSEKQKEFGEYFGKLHIHVSLSKPCVGQ